MSDESREKIPGSLIKDPEPKHSIRENGSREFRAFLKKLFFAKYETYRLGAAELCQQPEPPLTLPELVEMRAQQIEYLLNDPRDSDPRMSICRALEELLLGPRKSLPASDYGFDPSKP